MDEFDKKREVVKHLMDMLRTNAVSEVDGPPKTASVEKISVSPESEKMLHPEAEMHDDKSPDEMYALTGHEMPGMADGGMAEATDEPMRAMVDSIPEVSDGGNDGVPDKPETPIEEQDEDNNSSAFGAFMKRKKK